MELALVTDRWDEEGGGRERYCAELVRALDRRGHPTRVFCRDLQKGRIPGSAPRLHVFRGPRLIAEMRLERALAAYRAGYPSRPVLAVRPAYHATHYQLHSGLYSLAFSAERESFDSAARRALHPWATALNARRRHLLRLETHLLGPASALRVMAFSHSMVETLGQAHGTRRANTTVSYLGVNLHRFFPAPSARRAADPGGLQLLFVGHNFALKGLGWAMRAVARATAAGLEATLTVAGSGPVPAFRRLARGIGVDEHVKFVGAVDQARLAVLYQDSDLLVHPTFYDPFPRVVIEALASGCPIVTTERCGAAEIITPAVNGFLIGDPRDTDALVGALSETAAPEQRARLGSHAAALGRQFSFQAHVDTVTQWLNLE